MCRPIVSLVGTLLWLLLTSVGASAGESPANYCQRVPNDDTLRQAPASLMPAVEKLFGVGEHYPPGATFYRCADGRVMACVVGANLPCGKANTSTALPAADEWCRNNENADFIPMYITGHDTIYQWRCVGSVAKITGPAAEVDNRGFFIDYWRTVQ